MSNLAVETKKRIEVCDGNKAVAYGALMSRPDVVAVYPITPQSAVGEWLSRWHDEGKLDAEVVRVEGENSSMGVCCSASLTGGRVFTATSSWGLLFMTDGLHYAAAYRIPVVMTNANRETPGIFTIGNNSVFLDPDTKTMIAVGDPKKLRDESDDPKVRKFLTRGEG